MQRGRSALSQRSEGEPAGSPPEGVMEKRTSSRGSDRRAPGVLADLGEFLQNLARSLFDPYRPELYYMRGPGPKWHAKHERAAAYHPMPALVRVRAKR